MWHYSLLTMPILGLLLFLVMPPPLAAALYLAVALDSLLLFHRLGALGAGATAHPIV